MVNIEQLIDSKLESPYYDLDHDETCDKCARELREGIDEYYKYGYNKFICDDCIEINDVTLCERCNRYVDNDEYDDDLELCYYCCEDLNV